MPKLEILELKRFLPAKALTILKPYYRRMFPNRPILLINPTWRCNYRCSYCPIVTKFAYTTVVGKSGERSPEDWIAALARIRPALIYIAGGEPFVYADLAAVINGLPEKHHLLGIVTNLSQPASVYRKINRKIKLIASLHREHVEPDAYVAKVKELSGQFQIHANIVATPENLPFLDMIAKELHTAGVTLHVDPYIDVAGFHYSEDQLDILKRHIGPDRQPQAQQDYEDYAPRRCSAGRNYLTIAPDGSAYTCMAGMNFIHSHLYTEMVGDRDVSQFRMGNFFDPAFQLNQSDQLCAMPCNAACDRDSVIMRPA